ncbi:hypothetical protein NP493_3436g00008 [Ridgeia piscesae]|uniref:Uncharacterized protein n=1 Tax=Ridgeia piscesae TaxID=27915 RepID=A0AAD9J856_RIDPI|nr:hypothetical protein NP493_3436g00008 [Ridgeia piscesae]
MKTKDRGLEKRLPGLAAFEVINAQSVSRFFLGESAAEQMFLADWRTPVVLWPEIHVNNLEGRLPAVRTPFVGRAGEVTSLTDLLDTSGRLITVTGGAGCGKSQLAIVTAHAVVAKHHELFDLHMREMEMRFLCNWFNSHEQRLLFVFDNVDPVTSRDAGHVSEFIDELAAGVRDVRVLCTSRRAFYVGNSAAATSFALGDLRQDSENLLRQLTPDLHDDGIRNLAAACGHVVQALMVASRGLTMPEVDAGQLFEDLTTDGGNVTSSDEQEESEEETSRKVLTCLRHVLGHMGESAEGLLRALALFASWFDQSAASEVGTISDTDALATTLADLAKVGFLESRTRRDVDVYYVPHNARLLANSLGGASDGATRYRNYILGRMRTLQELYYSPECGDALQQFSDMADDIEAFLRSTIERGTAYRDCCHLAAIDPAVFLHETLPSMLFEELFSAIRDGSDADSSTKCRALCCLSYQDSGRGDFTAAKRAMTVAHDVTDYLAAVDDLTKAFCYECLSLVYWSEPDRQDPALALMKRALDVYKMALGMRSARTLLANEHYGAMLARRARLQSARHFFNVSDFAIAEVLDAHALLVRSYDERRAIWDALQLYGRSVEAAKKAADIARRYQGEHPLTANMLAKLCDAVMRRGSLHEAIDAATDTLHLRLKVLGDHDDTAASYKVLAYLMVRSGQYDEAIRFAQSALDIHAKGDEAVTDERRQVELKNLISQARYRLEYKSSVFVQIESKDASRANVNSSARSGEPRINANSGATNGKHRISSNDCAANGEQRVNGDHIASNGKTRVISNRSSVTNGETGVNKHGSAPIDETSVNRVCAMSTEV